MARAEQQSSPPFEPTLTMKFGINILNFGPGAGPDIFLRWARLAEALGFHFLMISDHIAVTPDVNAVYPAPFYDPFTVLSWLAAKTRKVELGTTVTIIPYRHPLQTARIVANIDQMSGGRFILGVGAGWAEQEFEALGVPFNHRGAITNEYLDVIRKAWSSDVISYDGQYVSFKNVHTAPRPARSPHPPIWVGGSSDAALRRAVRSGNAWHPLRIRVSWLENDGMPRLRRIAEAQGASVPDLCPRLSLRRTESTLDDNERMAGEGTLDQIRADLEGLSSLGAKYVLFDTYSGDPTSTQQPEIDWTLLSVLAERVLDLKHQSLR